MAEMFRMIPVNERPYEWARAELETYFKDAKKVRIVNLEELALKPNVHVSVFHKDGASIDIWRVYWSDTDSVKYSILTNYRELNEKHPETMKLLINNGIAAYELEVKRHQSNAKAQSYKPLVPIKKVDEKELELKRWKEELHELQTIRWQENAKKFAEARAKGTLLDNPLYDEAHNERMAIFDRMDELKKLIKEMEKNL